jgi:hypothetical protein
MPESSLRKIENSILKVSQEDKEIEKARREWRFTGSFKDHQKPCTSCELCGNTGLRYHFRIVNQYTGEALWVGSQCILQFDLSQSQRSYRAKSDSDKRRQIQAEIQTAQITRLLYPIQQLYEQVGKSDRRKIHWAVGKFQRRSGFSPKDLAWLLQAMQMLNIPYPADGYTLTLRSRQDRQEYTQLSISARRLIDPYLNHEQSIQLRG